MGKVKASKPRIKSALKLSFLALYSLAGTFLILSNRQTTVEKNHLIQIDIDPSEELGAFPIPVPTIKYGFAIDTFQVLSRTIQRNDFLADILLDQQIEYPVIDQLVKNSEGIFDIKNLRVGNDYVLLTKDSLSAPEYLVYEPSVYEYVVFELKDSLRVTRVERPVSTKVNTAEGTIESSLWNTMIDNGLSFELAAEMENALQWSIDFHRIQKGDEFKLVFEEKYIEGEAVGIGRLEAAYFKNYDKEFYAIFFEGEEEHAYYDLEGKPMKRAFLKSPIKKFSRISSYFNLNRFHPVLRRRRPHLGTDYAAPYGTPIQAVGNGVVTKASYTKGNGNFVKIRHDKTYETQYLHMQKFAKGIRPGVHVQQGDIIGYVGATGLATGPHVCFRFWKDGRQINHLRLSFPAKDPLPVAELPAFFEVRDDYLKKMKIDPGKVVTEETEAAP